MRSPKTPFLENPLQNSPAKTNIPLAYAVSEETPNDGKERQPSRTYHR